MFLKEFIIRFIGLETEFVSILKVEENAITFRLNKGTNIVVSDLEDLLQTIVPEDVGYFSVERSFNRGGVTLKFVEAEC